MKEFVSFAKLSQDCINMREGQPIHLLPSLFQEVCIQTQVKKIKKETKGIGSLLLLQLKRNENCCLPAQESLAFVVKGKVYCA